MMNDDSFNDSDEVFSLYSSKNVAKTFKAQLKKIVASSNHLNNASSHVNNEKDDSEKEKKNKSEETPELLNKLENSAQKATVDFDVNNDEGDSIEVIQEFSCKSRRRSERSKKKKKGKDTPEIEVINANLNRGCNKQRSGKKPRSTRRKQKRGKPVEVTIEDSPEPSEHEDELNPEISVKVIWKSVNIKKFQIRKFQKLSHIYELLSKEENVPEDKIMLTFDNIRVSRNDTPDSLNLQVYHFLDGGVLSESVDLCPSSDSHTSENNCNFISVKFQDVNKKVTVLNLNKSEKLKVGMVMCSEQLEIPLNKIKFFFDGELIQPSETPESLGLENGEIIDIKIIN